MKILAVFFCVFLSADLVFAWGDCGGWPNNSNHDRVRAIISKHVFGDLLYGSKLECKQMQRVCQLREFGVPNIKSAIDRFTDELKRDRYVPASFNLHLFENTQLSAFENELLVSDNDALGTPNHPYTTNLLTGLVCDTLDRRR